MKRKINKRAQSVLGLSLSDGQLRAFHVTRAKGALEVVKAASAELSLDLMHPEPELIGREIRNHLDAAGVRERLCIVRIPPRWVMSQQTKVPELSSEDTASFLQIEAEKGFPVDPAQLQIARSFQKSDAGTHVTQLAVRREQIDQLIAVLHAARLKPVSFSLGLAALPAAHVAAGTGRVIVAIDRAGVTLLVAAGGGITAFRTFEVNIDSEAGESIVNGAAVARELRITLEQVPAELRSQLRELYLTGDSGMVRQLAGSLGDWAKGLGLAIVRGDLPEKNLAAEIAEKLAGRWLEHDASELEFLPPHPGRWALLMARYNSKRLATAGFAVGAAALAVLAAFGWQEYERWSLRSEWGGMQAQVMKLDGVQRQIDEFKPWYDTTHRSLSILMRVTECFPDNGSVTAKTFEVRGSANALVSISGTARDNASLLRVQEQLRQAKEVQGLKIEQIRGKTPMQFTLTFRWRTSAGT
ncbi:MAG: hypothetical protein JNK23_18945 [Opitutaceae bacterium]|nr:hypothetical protein [Opitutaceae bacterium]